MSCAKQWIISKSDEKKPLIDRLLEVRGIVSEDAKNEFLHPLEITLTHPNAFCDMQKAVDRIVKAIDNKEKILVYGDFDADGVTSTSLLLKTFKFLGGEVEYCIPHRENEGHGLNSDFLVPYLKPSGPKLIITVDNGIGNVKEVEHLKSFGKDVIITDHHEAPDKLPPAYAIINPKAINSLDEKLTSKQIDYLTSLAGVGVAFKLAQGVLERYNKLEFSYELLPYVTVGTIADLVPLIGENRYFVTKGLDLIAQGKHKGLKRLLEVAGVNCENGLTSEQVAFTIAPRINASGRLDTVDAAIKLMTSESIQETEMAIATLNDFNKVRQELCAETFEEADEMWKATGMRDNAIVLAGSGWRVGIVGIVASKFVEKYYKPAFIMSYSEEDKMYKCSARGVKELNIYEIMSNISEYFEKFGGHKLAGGFTFDGNKYSFETIKKLLNTTVDEMLGGSKLNPSLDIDMELDIKDLDISLVEEISRLEPFGASNPSPAFVLKNLTLKEKKLMGATKEHLKLKIDTPNGIKDCVWWSKGDISLIAGDKLDIAFAPQLNTFNGVTDIQLIIKDIHSDALNQEEKPEIKIYDHRKKTDILSQVNDYIKNSKLGISVFAEDRTILESLKPYENIKSHTVNRQTAVKNDVLMFFDYPCSEDIYEEILRKTGAKSLHYMNYQNFKPDEEALLKAFASMIRYACNNLCGHFILVRAAAALGITEEITELLLDIFADAGMIKILAEEKDSYNIAFLDGIELSKAAKTPKYTEFTELMRSINEYKNNFMKIDLQS